MNKLLVIILSNNEHTKSFEDNPCKSTYYVTQVEGETQINILKNLILKDEYIQYYLSCKYHTDFVIIEQMIVDPKKEVRPLLEDLYAFLQFNDLDVDDDDSDTYILVEKFLRSDERVMARFDPDQTKKLLKYFEDARTYAPLIYGMWANMALMSEVVNQLEENQITKMAEILEKDDLILIHPLDNKSIMSFH